MAILPLLALSFRMLTHMIVRRITKIYRFFTAFGEQSFDDSNVVTEVSEITVACSNLLRTVLFGKVLLKGEKRFEDSLNSYWSSNSRAVQPHCIVSPENTEDVSTAMKVLSLANALTNNSCPFAIRSGGHAAFGMSNCCSGIVLDLRGLNGVSVNEDRTTVSIGPGSSWKDVYQKIDKLGLAVAGGRTGDVGVGGLTLGGGLSYLAPRMGFVCDNVLNFEIVIASGEVIHANSEEKRDLWLALRGGSNNFGIVTNFKMRAIEHTKMWGGGAYYSLDKADQLIKAFYKFNADPNYDENATIIQSFGYNEFRGLTGAGIFLDYTESVNNPPVFNDYLQIEQLFSTVRVGHLSEIAIEMTTASPAGFRQIFVTTTFKNELHVLEKGFELFKPTIDIIKKVDGVVHSWCTHGLPPTVLAKSREQGGNSFGLDQEREGLVIGLVTASWSSAKDDKFMQEICRGVITDLEAYTKETGTFHPYKFLNYADSWQKPFEGYGAENLAHLRAVSKKYDPQRVFQEAVPGGFKLFDEVVESEKET